jgi:Zn-dependent peptidase ImmA (M78 family)
MVVRINNNLWRIVFTYPQNPNLRMSDGRQVLGLCDNNIKTIFIADNQSDYKTEHILCHEITHAICFEYDIYLDYEMEEWLCNFMADHIREVVEILDTILSATLKKAYIA